MFVMASSVSKRAAASKGVHLSAASASVPSRSVKSAVKPASPSSSSSSAASSSPPSLFRRGSLSGSRHDSSYEGFTSDGERFVVPETLDTVATLLPWNWSITSLLTLSLLAANALCIAFAGWSKWPHVAYFLFFRLSYDVGLGAVLRAQSEHATFTRWYARQLAAVGGASSGHWVARVFHHLAASQIAHSSSQPAVDVDSYPTAFRAWLVYKNLVNVILINDGLNYLLLGIKCFHLPTELTWLVVLQYAVGVFLGVFNWWAKVDAHRCIGEYCWYWGDFFFRKEMQLTFDGIFELFPHPMYTVGYSLYYGYSLICRSYTMLFVSLLAHGLQLTFLFVVEEPHIERLYGKPSSESADSKSWHMLYDPKAGLFPAKRENVLFAHLDLFRSGDFALLVVALYGVLLSVWCPRSVLVLQVLLWRAVHWLGGGVILWQQGKRQLWTRHFERQGRDLHEAFAHWKRTYNLSLTLNFIVFVTCAMRYFHFEAADLLSGFRMACLVLGCAMVALSIWSFKSTYDAVGDFGWFYGDFFVPADKYKSSICYTGIYRFLNNPDCVTGYAGQYGLALICRSWVLFALAAVSHIAHIAFLNLVEIPHMHKLYGESELRGEGPLPRAIGKVTQTVSATIVPPTVRQAQRKMNDHLQQEIRRVRVAALTEMFELYQKMDAIRGKHMPESASASLSPSNTSRAGSGGPTMVAGTSNGLANDSQYSAGSDEVSGDEDEAGDSNEMSPPALTSEGYPRYMLNVPTQARVGQPITVLYTTDPVTTHTHTHTEQHTASHQTHSTRRPRGQAELAVMATVLTVDVVRPVLLRGCCRRCVWLVSF